MHYDETVSHEDRHRKGRPRVTSAAAEDKFIRVIWVAPQIAGQINALQSSSNRQHQLFRVECVSQAFMVELLQRNHC